MDLYAANSQSTSIPPLHLFSHLGFVPINFQFNRLFRKITFKEKQSDNGKHELKTIYVDTNATFLRFSFGRNYNSTTNSKNQVGIVELSIFGGEENKQQSLGETASTISIYKPRGLASRRSNFSGTKSSSLSSSSLSTSSIWRISSRQSSVSSRLDLFGIS
jgi:hypothetical protein